MDIFGQTTFLETTALECNFMEICMPTLEKKYIFGDTSPNTGKCKISAFFSF